MGLFSGKKSLPSLTAIHKELGEVLKKPESPDELSVIVYRKKPEPPPPDLSTKPKDIVGYCFGFACPKKHVQDFFESIPVDRYSDRKVCQKCGEVSKPCVVKKISEAIWRNTANDGQFFSLGYREPEPNWGWSQFFGGFVQPQATAWTRNEFFHYLESPTQRKK